MASAGPAQKAGSAAPSRRGKGPRPPCEPPDGVPFGLPALGVTGSDDVPPPLPFEDVPGRGAPEGPADEGAGG